MPRALLAQASAAVSVMGKEARKTRPRSLGDLKRLLFASVIACWRASAVYETGNRCRLSQGAGNTSFSGSGLLPAARDRLGSGLGELPFDIAASPYPSSSHVSGSLEKSRCKRGSVSVVWGLPGRDVKRVRLQGTGTLPRQGAGAIGAVAAQGDCYRPLSGRVVELGRVWSLFEHPCSRSVRNLQLFFPLIGYRRWRAQSSLSLVCRFRRVSIRR